MEEFGFGIGVLLAIFGPLLLLPVLWLLHRFVGRRVVRLAFRARLSEAHARWASVAFSLVVLAGALSVSYFPGKREFDRLCAQHATPVVTERVGVDGYYRNRLYRHEARQILDEGKFTFIEAPDMYKKERLVRYEKLEDGNVEDEEISELRSRYGVEKQFSQERFGILLTRKRIYALDTGKELARAADLVYQGGPLSVFLGVYAMSSCPDVRSPQGSERFNTFYHLENIVLAGHSGP